MFLLVFKQGQRRPEMYDRKPNKHSSEGKQNILFLTPSLQGILFLVEYGENAHCLAMMCPSNSPI